MAEPFAAMPEGTGASQLPAPRSLFAPFADPQGGPVLTRIGSFTAQPAVRRFLPVFVGLAAIGGALLAWDALGPSPQRVLYAQLDDADRAGVAAALEQAGISYHIDNSSGALTVGEGDYYRARMLVAADGALATPETGDQMLDKLPMGASRTLEGERLRAAREHDLQLTIAEIDGVDGARVHIAEGEKSVFVRDNVPPSASVMIRLKPGRQLSESQVGAIVNLVAASVPGLSPDAVRVVDQHGRLLSQQGGADTDRLDLQSRMEAKLREQVGQLLSPMLGESNFTSQAQVELDMADVTQARESYDKDGVIRSETQEQSQSTGAGPATGIPGALSNSPPPPTQARPGAPQGTPSPAASGTPPTNGETSSSRNYELGRQVSVSNSRPGGIKRLSVAVAVSAAALKGAKAQGIQDIQSLVSAAVGADPQRGDQVKVVIRDFEPAGVDTLPFYEAPWFAMVVRNGAAVLAVLLVLLIGVRPLVQALRGERTPPAKRGKSKAVAQIMGPGEDDETADGGHFLGGPASRLTGARADAETIDMDIDVSRSDLLSRQVDLAQRLVAEKPDSAVAALRQMINDPVDEGQTKAA
ncbi:flagellar M-ring protein FliF [Novosphingobium sp. PhB165]|uniref:flagellar basal-body MS-ring/collar protein FliF n=1 Tax=Novosphingobium sp. PhB165 TaxID=2485105 RepID=UPI001043DD07|nr:flagellar basal-body MS-ring/collar protein FliF [Novosphingobium sp. PhB165]TCM18864.1 flagellar M-ring protein FliF [Novosphingobium sp. PhB165]